MNSFIWYFIALMVGCATATQAGVNSQLRQTLVNPILSALISFCTGTLALTILFFLFNNKTSDYQTISKISWWKWTGGLLGAYIVTSTILSVPKIGSANMVALVVTGQILLAMVFDHFGWLGFPLHQVNLMRLLGAVLLIAGVILIVKY